MVYLEAAIQGFSLIQSLYFRQTSGILLGGGGSFPVELQALYLPFWWKWAPSWVFLKYFSYFIIYCVNNCFWGTALSCCFIIFDTLSIFNLTWKEGFLESTLGGLMCNKYLVLHQLFIKHQLCFGILERFPSQITNLLT